MKEYNAPDKVHEIRKLLKSLDYTIDSLSVINPTQKITKLIPQLKKMETAIGTWHDRGALIRFINRLIEKNTNASSDSIKPFIKVLTQLSRENKNALHQLKPKIEDIVKLLTSSLPPVIL